MKLFILWSLPIIVCGFFRPLYISIPMKQLNMRLLATKQTPYGKIEISTTEDLLEGIDNRKIDNVYFSQDMKEIYFTDTGIEDAITKKPIMRTVISNPIISEKILDRADIKQIQTQVLEPPINLLAEGGQFLISTFQFAFFTIICINLFKTFFTNNGMNLQFLLKDDSRMIDTTILNVTLDSWAGSREVFEECSEIVSYIKNASVYKAAGAEIPKGILLEGPPGTGKTLIAKAIAAETNATFLSMPASEFVEMFVGLGASKVRDLFEEARENKPAIIFIDEIDAVGKQRGGANIMGNDEREQTLNQLLAEMDGFASNDGIIVIAATNRKDVLDTALLRPGRFDRLVYVPLPDRSSREDILNLYMKNKKMAADIRIKYISEITTGFSGADLKNLLNEAAINSARSGTTVITQRHLEDALEKIMIGIVKKIDTRTPAARYRIALHEIGHAFLAAYFLDDFNLLKVSMKSTYNGVGGYTLFDEYPEVKDSGLYTKNLLKHRIVVALGGKAAETLVFGEEYVSLGATEDLKQANTIANEMIGQYGMGKDLETFYNENRSPSPEKSPYYNSYSNELMNKIDLETTEIVKLAFDEAKDILSFHMNKVEYLAQLLMNNTVLDGDIIRQHIFYM